MIFEILFFISICKSETDYILGSSVQEPPPPMQDGAVIKYQPSAKLREFVPSYWQKKSLEEQDLLSDGYLTDLDNREENKG